MVSAQQLIDHARTWINTPIGPAGSSRDGCTCLGLFAGVARELGLAEVYEPFAPYETVQLPQDRRFMIRKMRESLIRTPHKSLKNARPGSLAITREDEFPSHVILYCGRGTIIEAGKWKVCEVSMNRRPNIIEVYELPGVEYT